MKSTTTPSSIAIIGTGCTGRSFLQFLCDELAIAADIHVFDTRDNPPTLGGLKQQYPEVTWHTGTLVEDALTSFDEIYLSPGIPKYSPAIQRAVQNNIPVIGDIELFARHAKAPILALTGTNGKSTVTTLVTALLEADGKVVAMGGNIGKPALDLLAKNHPTPDYYVLELSSFQLELVDSLRPFSAAILNIAPDHLDRYANFDEYVAAKQRIYMHAENVVYDQYAPITAPVNGLAANSKHILFTEHAPAKSVYGVIEDKKNQFYLSRGAEKIFACKNLKIYGRQNWLNCLASLAIVEPCGISAEAINKAFSSYAGLPHRCQLVREFAGVSYYNDSKGTNVAASYAAIVAIGKELSQIANNGKVVLIAGGILKERDFAPLVRASEQYVKAVVLLGKDRPLIRAALEPLVPCYDVDDMQQAVTQARQLAEPHDAVLLSPASASFDMFRNFVERGEVFTACVQELA